jgi:hypothetical protein
MNPCVSIEHLLSRARHVVFRFCCRAGAGKYKISGKVR